MFRAVRRTQSLATSIWGVPRKKKILIISCIVSYNILHIRVQYSYNTIPPQYPHTNKHTRTHTHTHTSEGKQNLPVYDFNDVSNESMQSLLKNLSTPSNPITPFSVLYYNISSLVQGSTTFFRKASFRKASFEKQPFEKQPFESSLSKSIFI